LGIRSRGRWIFSESILEWITEPRYRNQLPLLYRLFAAYCRIAIRLLGGKRIFGAEILLRLLILVQRAFSPKTSSRIELSDLEIYLDLHDPRFLVVGNEVIKGEIDKVLSPFLQEGDTFVDVGANQGAYSMIASKYVGESGLVVSIEPQLRFASNTEKSLALGKRCRFEVHQMAVGDLDSTIDLIIPRSYSGTAGVYPEHSGIGRHTRVQVRLKRFDESIGWRNFPGSVFVKLDIEGSEFAFLKGAEEMIRTVNPLLLMEMNPSSLRASKTDVKELLDLLMDLGYTHYRYPDDVGVFYPIRSIEVDEVRNVLFSKSEMPA
jgi:FkbM family methyltransferase